MKKWEYNFYNRRGAPWHEMLQELNELGSRGWEMVSSYVDIRIEEGEKILYYHAVMKRQVTS
jgi:hypothetical protein